MSLQRRDALFSRLIGEHWPFAPLLDAFQVPTEAHVLDIGGGEGGLLRELTRRGHSGRRELIDPLQGGDAHALPFADCTFDTVFMLRVLGHLHTPALALAEAVRVLVPGGRLLVAAHGPEHLAGVLPAGRPAGFPAALPSVEVQPIQVSRPVRLSVADVQELAVSFGLSLHLTGAVNTQLQLSGFVVARV